MQTHVTRLLLGRFEVMNTLGEGQFGRVYRALDRQLRREIALKEFSEKVSQQGGASFQREMRLLSHLSHPALVKVYDLLVDEATGLHYFSQDLVRGTDLATFLRAATWDGRWAVLVQVLQGLEYLHQRNLIHLDIKPSNILVETAREGAVAKLLDFGITEEVSRFDRRRIVAGTFPYMAPEVARRDHVDGRADLYSLGMSLFEVFKKEKEGPAPSSAAAEPADVAGGTVAEDHTVAGEARGGWDVESLIEETLSRQAPGLEDFAPEVPQEVREIVVTLLHPSPRRRFWSANDVIRRINRRCRKTYPLEPGRRRLPDKGTAVLLGRDRLLTEVKDRVASVGQNPSGIVLDIVAGGAQSGKTALLEEMKREAELSDRALVTLLGRDEGLPQLFDRLLGPKNPAHLEPFFPYLKCLLGERFSGAPDPPDLETSPSLRLRGLMEKWSQALTAALEGRKILVLVDDLDRKSDLREFLTEVTLHMTSSSPARSQGQGLLHFLASVSLVPDNASRRGLGGVFQLDPWTEEDLALVLPSLLGTDEAPAQLARFLSERTEGRPGLVVEYVRLLFSSALRADEDVAGQLEVVDLGRLSLLPDLAAWHSGELEGLPALERRVVGLYGVAPSGLTDSDLGRLMPDLAPSLQQAIRHLEASGWIRQAGGGMRTISSEMRRQSVLQAMTADQSAALHRRIAESWPDLDLSRAFAAAHDRGNLTRSEEYLLGGEVGAGFGLAFPLIGAMVRRGQPASARSFLERHVKSAETLPGTEARTYREWLAEARLHSGVFPEAIVAYEELRAGAVTAEDHTKASLGLARACRFGGRLDQALTTVLEAVEKLPERDPRVQALEALRADILLELGRFKEAEEMANSRLHDDPLGPGPERLSFRNVLGKCLFYRSMFDEAAGMFELNAGEARDLGRMDSRALALNALGVVRLHQGRLEEAIAHFEESLNLAQDVGDLRTVALAHANLGLAHQRRGDAKAGSASYEKAAAMFRRIGAAMEEARTLCNLGVLKCKARDLEGAEEVLAQAEGLAHAQGLEHLESNIRLAKSNCLLLRGASTEALAECEGALAGFRGAHMTRDALSARLRKAEILAALGRALEASIELEACASECGPSAPLSVQAMLLYVKGRLRALDDAADGLAVLRSALAKVEQETPRDTDLEQKVKDAIEELRREERARTNPVA